MISLLIGRSSSFAACLTVSSRSRGKRTENRFICSFCPMYTFYITLYTLSRVLRVRFPQCPSPNKERRSHPRPLKGDGSSRAGSITTSGHFPFANENRVVHCLRTILKRSNKSSGNCILYVLAASAVVRAARRHRL